MAEWQTHKTQNLAGVTSCGFKSHHPQPYGNPCVSRISCDAERVFPDEGEAFFCDLTSVVTSTAITLGIAVVFMRCMSRLDRIGMYLSDLKIKGIKIMSFYSLPEGQRAELIDGRIYMMTPPDTIHQKISYSVARKISDYIDKKNGDCDVFLAPFAVFLNADDINYVEPDISVICNKNKLDDVFQICYKQLGLILCFYPLMDLYTGEMIKTFSCADRYALYRDII